MNSLKKLLLIVFFITTTKTFSQDIFIDSIFPVSVCAGGTISIKYDVSELADGVTFSIIMSDENGLPTNPPNILFTSTTPTTDSIAVVTIPLNAVPSQIYQFIIATSDVTPIVSPPSNTFAVVVPQPFTLSLSATDNTICPSETITFTATTTPAAISGIQYKWYVNSVLIPSQNSATYTNTSLNQALNTIKCVANVGSQSCVEKDSANIEITVAADDTLKASVVGVKSVYCLGDTVTLRTTLKNGFNGTEIFQYTAVATNGLSFNLGNGQTIGNINTLKTISIPANAIISVKITSNQTCILDNPLTLTVPVLVKVISPQPSISLIQTQPFCSNSGNTGRITATFQNGGPAPVFKWFLNGTLQANDNPVFFTQNAAEGDIIRCEIVSNDECVTNNTNFAQIAVNVKESPVVEGFIRPTDTCITYGKEATLYLTKAFNAQYWEPAVKIINCCAEQRLTKVTPRRTQYFSVTVTAANGCTAKDSVEVCVEPITEVYVPNIFSPNGDDLNDELYVRNIPDQIKEGSFLFEVFDKFGQKVFESKYQYYGWDGTFRNKLCEQGAYTWHLVGQYFDNTFLEQSGKVVLVYK
jgi:gliding motility-associated-like protein